ncbi:MAG TPA: PhzF family phenazine biosynthesis protein [Burkholderiales bacterium]|nr:PhzF family phenazine biosynthesis protein [Burkholderiales bacterium]
MARVDFTTVDVFTSTRFGGNPLAVIPDARRLSATAMQRIAREFNWSEVAFVLPPRDAANTARVRIFTPVAEIPFAGHPNVGTAYVLGQENALFGVPFGDRMRFEEAAGVVEVNLSRISGRVVGARIRAPQPLEIGDTLDPDAVAACASLRPEDIMTDNHEPVLASVGLPFVLAQVADLKALARARPNISLFAGAARNHGMNGRLSLFLYHRRPNNLADLRARMFAPLSNTVEDPATGSASAALGAYLVSRQKDRDVSANLVIKQGVEMGRPSVIKLHVRKVHGSVSQVSVAGHCVAVMRGTIET